MHFSLFRRLSHASFHLIQAWAGHRLKQVLSHAFVPDSAASHTRSGLLPYFSKNNTFPLFEKHNRSQYKAHDEAELGTEACDKILFQPFKPVPSLCSDWAKRGVP